MKDNQGYKKLIVWQNLHKLRRLIYEITKKFPKSELRRINHMRDTAISAKQNIQEGYKRSYSLAEYILLLLYHKVHLQNLQVMLKTLLRME